MMTDKICFATIDNSLEFVEAEPAKEWPHKWEKDTVTYSVTRGSEDMPGERPERLALNYAMTLWDVEIKTRLKWVPKDENPDIRIEFRTSNEDEYFKRKKGVLAYAYYPGQGENSGLIVVNDDYIWGLAPGSIQITNPDGSTSNVRIYHFAHTIAHEIGHSLGLTHAESCKECVMYPYYNKQTVLQEHDIYRIRQKYGTRTFTSWARYWLLKKILQRRINNLTKQ